MTDPVIDMKLTTTLQFLSQMLDKISEHPQVLASNDLNKYVQDARASYNDIMQYLEPYFDEHREMGRQLYHLTISPNDRLIWEDDSPWKQRYEVIRDAGGTPELINEIAKREGIQQIYRIKILRSLFNLDLLSARGIVG